METTWTATAAEPAEAGWLASEAGGGWARVSPGCFSDLVAIFITYYIIITCQRAGARRRVGRVTCKP